jgi:hypothetical protein
MCRGGRVNRNATTIAVQLAASGVATGVAVVVNIATESGQNPVIWALVVVLTLLAGLLAALLDRAPAGHDAPARAPQPVGPGGGFVAPRPPLPPVRRRSGSRLVAAVVALAITAVTVVAVSGVRYAVGYVTGKESGQDRLEEPVSVTDGPVTLTVDRVEVTRHTTRVGLAVTNRGTDSLRIPVFGNTSFVANGVGAKGSSFASEWADDVPPGQTVRGVVVFRTRPPAAAVEAAFSFNTIFGSLGAPRQVGVSGLRLRPGPGSEDAAARPATPAAATEAPPATPTRRPENRRVELVDETPEGFPGGRDWAHLEFRPPRVTVQAGDSVTWVNRSGYECELVAEVNELPRGKGDNPLAGSGDRFTIVFTEEVIREVGQPVLPVGCAGDQVGVTLVELSRP